MSAGTKPQKPTEPPEPAERPLSPGEALVKLFLDNADKGRNAANDELVAALRQRVKQIHTRRLPPSRRAQH